MSTAISPIGDQTLAWTPEALREEVERERALRTVVLDYYKSQLKQGHHYYNLPGEGRNRKPALAKEGALNLCSLFKVTPDPEEPHEVLSPDGHYTVRYRYHLRSVRTGQVVATGDGSCSTREAKYAYRWLWERDVPKDADKDTLPKRRLKTRNGWATQYRVPNDDLADTYNTVLKMASKRALVEAVLKLPLVSELFTQDLEEQITDRTEDETTDEPGAEPAGSPAGAPAQPSAPAPAGGETALHRLERVQQAAGMTEAQVILLAHRLPDMPPFRQLPDLPDEKLHDICDEIEARMLSVKGA